MNNLEDTLKGTAKGLLLFVLLPLLYILISGCGPEPKPRDPEPMTAASARSRYVDKKVEVLEEALTAIEALEKLGLKTVKAKMKELKVGDLKRRIKRYF